VSEQARERERGERERESVNVCERVGVRRVRLSERVRVGVLTCSLTRFKEEKERLYLQSHAAELATLHGFVQKCLLDGITPCAHYSCWR